MEAEQTPNGLMALPFDKDLSNCSFHYKKFYHLEGKSSVKPG